MEGLEFTVKEIVQDTNRKLDKFIDKVDKTFYETDKRLDTLEQHKASVNANFKFAAWMFGAAISIGGMLVALKLI